MKTKKNPKKKENNLFFDWQIAFQNTKKIPKIPKQQQQQTRNEKK